MSLLRPLARPESPHLSGPRLYLRPPELRDYPAWSDLREASRNFLAPWEPTWPDDDLTREAYRRRLRRYQRDAREDLGYAFFLFEVETDALIGGLTLSNLRRGVTQSAALGYWTGEPFAGQGYMSEAVRAVSAHVFEDLHLHRLEAACLPSNARSRRLLCRVGFQEEGFARAYLRIDGAWRDHVLFALIEADYFAAR